MASALALAVAYGLAFPLPFLAPLFVVFLSARPGPPLAARAVLALLLVMALSLGVGVLLIPLLVYFPVTAILVVFGGLYLSMYVTLILGKQVLGLFLTVGFTLISVAGSVSSVLATAIIVSLGLAIGTAVACLWLVYPLLPEPEAPAPPAAQEGEAVSVSKSVSLGQQATVVDVHHAGRELLGSTFAGGVLAVIFWALLTLHPTLWMFTLWMAAAGLYVGCKLYGVLRTTVAPSFWVNALVTMLILLGPAVEDTASGKDAVTAFGLRFATFIGVTLYAWVAIAALERWREARRTARVAA